MSTKYLLKVANKIEYKYFKIATSPSGGLPISGKHFKTEISIRDLLKMDIAYDKIIDEIDSNISHADREWSVYQNVLNIKNSLLSDLDLKSLPPIQIVKDKKIEKVVDGAHRLNALKLISKQHPEILNFKLNVEVYDESTYQKSIRELGKKA